MRNEVLIVNLNPKPNMYLSYLATMDFNLNKYN
jgi:hypothetical protein